MPNEPFIATCKASDLAAVKEHGLPILEPLQKEALHDFLSFQPGLGSTNIAIHDLDLHDFHASPEPLLQADVHEDSVAFTTPVCPEDPSSPGNRIQTACAMSFPARTFSGSEVPMTWNFRSPAIPMCRSIRKRRAIPSTSSGA